MDRSVHLILKKNGENITGKVESCEYNSSTQKYDVKFHQGEKIYSFNYDSIEWVMNPDVVAIASVCISHNGRELIKNQFGAISVFHAEATDYWYIRFLNGREETYDSKDLKITYSCLSENEAQNCMNYLQELASLNELKNDETGEVLLQKQYENLDFVRTDTVMAVYMNPLKHKLRTHQRDGFIFPFGGNTSQFKAVVNALSNQVSIVQGPPGTGKTQTILNIIANLLIMGKTVQIVSNNNSATLNILEKLSSPQYALEFLVAKLGKTENKKEFIENQTGFYPSALTDWELNTSQQSDLREKIQGYVRELSAAFSAQEHLAQARAELDSLQLEIKYFEQYYSEVNLTYPEMKPHRYIGAEKIMKLWQECREFSERERTISLWFKIKATFFYGISDWKFYRNDLSIIVTLIQRLFYHAKKLELSNEITKLESQLTVVNAKDKMAELTEWSMAFLRAKLFERYGNKPERARFSEDDLWKCAGKVAEEYPIVLSTTFSSCSSLKGVTYDYLIMDEASQVDIATGALALSCAGNAVIVGDLKQLPNVVKEDMKKRCDAIFGSYNLPQGYSFSENSFLKSVSSILQDAPQTLLREHYRCHPKIIGFCNQKFYNNELVIMTEDHGEPDVLTVFKTVDGDHERERTNQRQIDVTIREALPMLSDLQPQDVGVIAPYRNQVTSITQQLGPSPIEVDTVHKFQGREKDTILLTTVDDVVTDFSDDPYLLNVAVSRAKKRLGLIVSGNEQPNDSNIGDLISYIEYNNFKVVQSEIRSVFDLLYRQYTDARIDFLKRHSRVSAYNSENVMYGEIVDILKHYSNLSLNVICHQSLNMLLRDTKFMSDEERRYIMNPATHVDFLLYNQISKKPVLAIEVDGFHYHKPGTAQHKRDKMKDRILELYGIPLLRFPTNGSEERAKIERFLAEYANKIDHTKRVHSLANYDRR